MNFKYEIGDCFSDSKRKILIIGREFRLKEKTKNGKRYNRNEKYYKYRCLLCGNEDWIVEYAVNGKNQKIGCNVCGDMPKKLVQGKNDITATAPWMVKYFIGGEEEASHYFQYQKIKVDMRCPFCGRLHRNRMIGSVCNNHNLTCQCQDGWSYPNKFMFSFFEQLDVKFEVEKQFDWGGKYRYDLYIEYNGLKIICEQNGMQHYKNVPVFSGRNFKDEIVNDENKKKLALDNGIDEYIVLDCRYSTAHYIINSIWNSSLKSIFNLEDKEIDFALCDEFALKNIAKEVCKYKNIHPELNIETIAEIFHISYSTALKYIKIGSSYNWCVYSKDQNIKNRKYEHGHPSFKPIYCITLNQYFENSKIAQEKLSDQLNEKILIQGIQKSAREGKSYKNLLFKYVSWEEASKNRKD